MKKLITLLLGILYLSTTLNATKPSLSDYNLVLEGRRIGRNYHLALKSGDIDMQNNALNQFNEILSTLRTQRQVNILTKAFNNMNISTTKPESDALLYSRALIKARATGDGIAVDDAYDIAKAVKHVYDLDGDSIAGKTYTRLFDIAAKGAMWGYDFKNADSNEQAKIKSDANVFKKQFSTDSIATKIFNDSFDYHTINISTPEKDAQIYSLEMKLATDTGNQARVDDVARLIGMIYEHYAIERNADEAEQFKNLINELIEKN